MRDAGLGSWPARRARMSPAKVALRQGGRAVTYAQLDALVTRTAHGLRARGVRRGDRVAYLGANSVEFVVCMFATARIGAVFLPLNTRLAPPELAYILADSSPRLLVWAAGFEDVVQSADLARAAYEAVRVDRDGLGELSSETDPIEESDPIDEPVTLDELFMIQYTSGTSGRPKGVMLTHGNVVWNTYNLIVDVDLRADEVALVVAPLFHTAALNQILMPTLLKGGTALLEAKFDADRVLELIERHGVTALFGVTSMYLALAESQRWTDSDLSSLRTAICGGAPVPLSLLEAWRDRGVGVVQGYGLTEASPGATMLRGADPADRLGSAGTPCFFSDVRIGGFGLGPPRRGEPGEILVQGPNLSPGYWGQAAATEAAFRADGWLRTGDLGRMDDDGYLYVVDRVKDMFISGGENVYPAEVEQAVYSHPAVAEVAVIGVPDERWGEVGRAVVVVRHGETLDEAALLEHLEGRLGRYKIPRSVTFVDELPHNASGKLLKKRVRELYGTTPGAPR